MKRFLLVAAAGLVGPVLALSGCQSAPPSTDDDSPQLSPEAAAQIDQLLAEKAARTPAQRKISSALLYQSTGRFANLPQSKDPDKQIRPLTKTDKLGRVLVDIKGTFAAGRIEALGGSVVSTSKTSASTRAWLDLKTMETLASDATVTAIHPAFAATTQRANGPHPKFHAGSYEDRVAAMVQAQHKWMERAQVSRLASPTTNLVTSTGAATSEGRKAHGVDRAAKQYNVDGTGVTIGVLSDSDDHKEESIASGDLPPDTATIPGQDGRPGSGEGTAMMEIAHDMAPGAKLVFATAFISPESFADNIRRLRFEFHCDVILDDIIYFFESPYEDDIIAQAVEDVVADGAVYVSSAGNGGNMNDGTSGTWEGDYRPAGTLATLPSGYTVHSFGNKVISDRIEVGGGPLLMHCSDPGTLAAPAAFNDYDLFVLDNDLRNVVLASTDLQDGAGLPLEFLGFNIPAGFRVVVAKHPNAETRTVRVVIFGGELGLATFGSTYGHNSTEHGMGAAAVDVVEASGGEFFAGPTTPVELYSSDGPRRVFYDRNNNPLTPGKFTIAGGGGQLRVKPDAAGADGVSTTLPSFSGLNPFFGTSAAAPAIGGIAALLKSAVPSATPAQIKKAILDGALDIEAAGLDFDSGKGLAFAPDALKKLGAPPAVFIEQRTITVTPVGSDALLPGGSATMRVQIINNGLAKATAVTGTLSSTSPNVHITSATSTYPNVFPNGGTATDPTAYAFTIDPATPCGAKLPFTLTIDYTGNGPHPTTIDFQLQTGRVGPPTTIFTYAGAPVAIPDGDSTGVDIPFTVASTGPVANVVFSFDGSVCSSTEGSTTVGVDHTWVGDLTFTLTSPSGSTVTLLSAAGGAFNSGNNFCQTRLDDTGATSIQDVTVADAPFTGTFKPLNALGAFSGEDASGTWTLHAADNASFDTGSVRAFSITASGFTCTP